MPGNRKHTLNRPVTHLEYVENNVACIASLEGKVTNYILESSETINFITQEHSFFQYFNIYK